MKRVLIATDGSDHALKAADLGTELAIKMDGAELHILAVAYYEPSEEVELRKFAQIEHLDGGLMNIAQELAQSHTARARLKAEEKGAKSIKTAVIVGDPATEILAYITANSIDAVVVGRRGKGRIAGLLLGSVSQKLASLAPCVVVICP
jgi:nucleotide-binding universal stress UspA family protein